jgi:Zn-dependent peptidase ImmA (M78 family)
MAPLGYFFLPEPPEEKLPIPDFRTLDDAPVRRPSPNLLDTVYTMQRRQGWLRDERIEQGHEPLAFVRSTTVQAVPATVAAAIRRALGVSAGWADLHRTWTEALRALRVHIEEAGIVVVINGVVGNNNYRKLDPQEFRGFVLVDEYAPLIFVNGSDGKAAQMFTLAHELAHLWVGQDAVFNLRDMLPASVGVEQFCNRVAAEFLIPEAEMRDVWRTARNSADPYQFIARRFKVSELVAARRALDLRLINRDAFFQFYNQYLERERRAATSKAEGGDFYATQNARVGRAFGQAVVQAVREGRLLYRDAFELTGLHGATFDKYASKLGLQVGE